MAHFDCIWISLLRSAHGYQPPTGKPVTTTGGRDKARSGAEHSWVRIPDISSLMAHSDCIWISLLRSAHGYQPPTGKPVTITGGRDKAWSLLAHGTQLVPYVRGSHPYDQVVSFPAGDWQRSMHVLPTMERSVTRRVLELRALCFIHWHL